MEMSKNYDARKAEEKWRKHWEKSRVYCFNNKSKKKIYSIDTPPPTVSGGIHMGHAFSYTHTDIIARYKRMQGFNVFYPFGFDNNGLPTERLVEKEKNVRAKDTPRKKFNNMCLQVSKEYEDMFKKFWGELGLSVDWSLLYSTIEPRVQRLSQRSFIELYKKGREYRKEAPTIWCPECQTAIAQVELEDKELSSTFNDILFEIEGKHVTIATTRPELLPGCVAIFFHPDDERYRHLKGKKAKVPLFNYKVPILEDKNVDPEKGTGLMMCCTFGDVDDVDKWYKHNLPLRMSIRKDGVMDKLAQKYEGLSIKEARGEIIKDLEENKLLTTQKHITHVVNVHERCGTEIEFMVTKQWFIKYLDLKKEFLEFGKKLNWYPEHMRVRYDNWIKGLQWDWLISRQRYYGIPFPVWYCEKCGEVILAEDSQLPVDPLKDKPKKFCKCGSKEVVPEKDIMDTWATSSLTPQINAKWKDNENLFKKIYPMDLRPQGHDIITFWLFNTVVKSYLHGKKTPWRDVMISGHGLDPQGKKMSKSKGSPYNPIELLKKYPADAIRFWAAGSRLGDDLPYQEKDVLTGQKTVIKLWNAARFSFMHLKGYKLKKTRLEGFDKWVLIKLNRIIKTSTEGFENYEYSKTKLGVENFFWNTFADYYLEIIKDRLYNPEKRGKQERVSAQYTAYTSFLAIIKLLAPIMPFITEEIYQMYYSKREKEKSVHVSMWPKIEKLEDKDIEKGGDRAIEIISEVRKFKAKNKKSLKEEIYLTLDKKDEKILKPFIGDLGAVTFAKKIEFGKFKISF
ncbi:MAG: valine--tRNA ligase [Candidatus Woesearchaeota archaeon]